MSEITMVGLGAMGSAVARALIGNGYDLTVWNRSEKKAAGIRELGGAFAGSLKDAIAASPIILVCIHGYQATRSLLDDPDIRPLLAGRTIVQMSTGTPAEARAAEDWVISRGGNYLDCAIMVYPPDIGKPSAQLLFSGARESYQACSAFAQALGGDIRYLGSAVGAAAALDMAVVTRLATRTVAIVYGLHICESEGVPLHHYTGMFADGDRSRHLARNIQNGDFERHIEASVGTAIEVISAIRSMAVDLGLNTELPDFILGLYQRTAAAGYREQDNAVLIEVFRDADG